MYDLLLILVWLKQYVWSPIDIIKTKAIYGLLLILVWLKPYVWSPIDISLIKAICMASY